MLYIYKYIHMENRYNIYIDRYMVYIYVYIHGLYIYILYGCQLYYIYIYIFMHGYFDVDCRHRFF